MAKVKSPYHGHRFPAAVINCAVRWYLRFNLSLCGIEEPLFEGGIVASHEMIRRWCDKIGAGIPLRVKATRRKAGSTWRLDEKLVTLHGKPNLLWRAVEHGAGPAILL